MLVYLKKDSGNVYDEVNPENYDWLLKSIKTNK